VLRAKAGQLSVIHAPGDALLRQAIGNVLSQRHAAMPGLGGDFMLTERRRDLGPMRRLAVSVGPFPRSETDRILVEPCAIVVLREMTLEISPGLAEHAQHLFGLTTKEAQLAAALTGGQSLKQAAETEKIAFSTARSYLERIFIKTGTRQQSQLVALLKNLQPRWSR
jgi:DNA-binding CsgD family transcriptional regulator